MNDSILQKTQETSPSILNLLNLKKIDLNGKMAQVKKIFKENYFNIRNSNINSFSIAGIIDHPKHKIKILYSGDTPKNKPTITPDFLINSSIISKNDLFLSKYIKTGGSFIASLFTVDDFRCLHLHEIKNKIKDIYFVDPQTCYLYKIELKFLTKKI